MKFPAFSRRMTGVAVPVSALRSAKSFGIGEFLDLPALGEFCKAAGLDLIQILPVNDTGSQPSPYSALSACALHPVYISLESLPELSADKSSDSKDILAEIKKSKKELEAPRVDFYRVWQIKMEFLRRIYAAFQEKILKDPALDAWMAENLWIKPYALFSSLKEKNGGASWVAWKTLRKPKEADIEAAWNKKGGKAALGFFAWVQMRLEEQLRAAAELLEKQGVLLKGDLPIMMSEDSADVWAHPGIFTRGLRAGAPPDMYSLIGQNWGFPLYDWKAQSADGYAWWKTRLRRADLFYHAYRIDHVLGFFRIWAIPEEEKDGVLGYFKPAQDISRESLEEAGFDRGRIRWMSRPHVTGDCLRGVLGDAAQSVIEKLFTRLEGEDLYIFKDEASESVIWALGLPEAAAEALVGFYRDRLFIETKAGMFAPAWFRDNSQAWMSLEGEEKEKIAAIIDRYFKKSEEHWKTDGGALLRFMKESSSMLPCAEDLGVVPESVPGVLEGLGILGLRIPRWTRRYREAGEPFILPAEYPRLSVCAASVHDTSTLREWWETETGKEDFWKALGLPGEAPADYTTDTAEKVFAGLLEAESAIVMFQLQDFFALEESLRAASSAEERINVPGTIADTNWAYRMPQCLEEFDARGNLARRIAALVKKRKERKLP
ncbi:MAG: 4-alpha-glucanotransferase [Spirochaetaceae bacterium]|nr:4-alpha-glucanotransferase [Spirochaetaceae bacterium]